MNTQSQSGEFKTDDAAKANTTAGDIPRHAREGAQAASILLGLGYSVIPVVGKEPHERGWQTKPYPIFELRARLGFGNNLGVRFGQTLADGTVLVAFDADLPVAEAAGVVRPLLGDYPVRIGRAPEVPDAAPRPARRRLQPRPQLFLQRRRRRG